MLVSARSLAVLRLPNLCGCEVLNLVAKTVVHGFQELRSRLEITNLQSSAVSKRHQHIRDILKKELPVLEDGGDFLTGSYVRNTMIAPLKDADIDIFFVLDRSYYYDNDQASLLNKVKTTLKKVYPQTTDISRDGQAVTISFHDFRVDVVPCAGYLVHPFTEND